MGTPCISRHGGSLLCKWKSLPRRCFVFVVFGVYSLYISPWLGLFDFLKSGPLTKPQGSDSVAAWRRKKHSSIEIAKVEQRPTKIFLLPGMVCSKGRINCPRASSRFASIWLSGWAGGNQNRAVVGFLAVGTPGVETWILGAKL